MKRHLLETNKNRRGATTKKEKGKEMEKTVLKRGGRKNGMYVSALLVLYFTQNGYFAPETATAGLVVS